MSPDEVREGVVLHFRAPDMGPDFKGPVRKVADGFAWIGEERWPLDVVARESIALPRPTPDHRWDGATDRWYLPQETQPTDGAIVLSHVRHA